MDRRSFLRSGLAAFALATGLARVAITAASNPAREPPEPYWLGIDLAKPVGNLVGAEVKGTTDATVIVIRRGDDMLFTQAFEPMGVRDTADAIQEAMDRYPIDYVSFKRARGWREELLVAELENRGLLENERGEPVTDWVPFFGSAGR